MSEEQSYWRKCSTCRKEIAFSSIYQKCSVSSCRKSVYCSVSCWDAHVPIMNHKSAWAEEERAPRKDEALSDERPNRRIIVNSPRPTSPAANTNDVPIDILIVVSKLKAYIKAKHDLNTSADVMDHLSDMLRYYVDEACMRAKQSERKTLMKRDFN